MSEARSWVERIGRRLARWRSHGLPETWVVAVSGGGDSVGLLRILGQLAPTVGLRLSVAHLDHGVRGAAAREDAAFVAGLAASLGLPMDLGGWRPDRAGHFESDARRARYAWLVEVARARGAGVVAVGHTRDDQAETILHRILRGTGPRGLAGIPARRPLGTEPAVELVRPVLGVSRESIRAYLQELGQPFREDATNADLSRTRTRIRHDLLPRLTADYNPRVAEALIRLGSLAAASQRTIEGIVRETTQSAVISRGESAVVLKHGLLRSLPLYLRTEVLRRVWREAGWPEAGMSAKRWRRLGQDVRNVNSGCVPIAAGVSFGADGSFLVLRRSSAEVPPSIGAAAPIELEVPGTVEVPWASGRVVATIEPGEASDESIDLDRLSVPLSVRPPAAGDRFAPLGMGGRSTPLADFFRGRGIPRDRRPRIPLVCDRDGIVWVIGHRIAERVKITGETTRRLGLSWIADG